MNEFRDAAAQQTSFRRPGPSSGDQDPSSQGRFASSGMSNSGDHHGGSPHVAPQAALMTGETQQVDAAMGGFNGFNSHAHLDYAPFPGACYSDNLNLHEDPYYGESQGAFGPSMRGGDGEIGLVGASANGVVFGREQDDVTAIGHMNSTRASLISADPSEYDQDQDFYEGPPLQQPCRKTGSNNVPLEPPVIGGWNEPAVSNPSRELLTSNNSNGERLGQSMARPDLDMGRVAPRTSGSEWDFNSGEPLPWNIPTHNNQSLQIREFAKCNDADLLTYLSNRHVSTGFLVEIDQFLRSHPEIATYASGKIFLENVTTLPPLEAYQYFLKGYTRPARYVDGIIISGGFTLPVGFRPPSLRTIKDEELDAFFDGFDYRYDVLDQIDNEVSAACVELSYGRPVSYNLRLLVCYAAWGNPVDAYKWYEYNYQQEYMPHRYLHEHIVLGDAPKSEDYTEPEPSVMESCKKHRGVRLRMARAKDQGVDVIDVLLSEYRNALVRKGYRRADVANLCSRAQRRIDDERQDPRGVDVVDMIMDDAVGRFPGRRPAAHRYAVLRPAVFRPVVFRSSVPRPSASRPHVPPSSRTFMRNNGTNTLSSLTVQASELRQVKSILRRLYTQEETALARSSRRSAMDTTAISKRRATMERRYVNTLIRYCRDVKSMSSSEAGDLQRRFTRDKMVGMGLANKDYLLGLYPRELN